MKKIFFALVSLAIFSSCKQQQPEMYSLVPTQNAADVCVDTHLTLTFHQNVKVGNYGFVRIVDKATGIVIDSLDISIPAGPTESRQYGPDCDYTKIPYDYSRTAMPTNRDTKPGTPSGTAEPNSTDFQLNIIGGFTDAFHFYPIIVHDSVATIYPHNNMLEFGHTYSVYIDDSVFQLDSVKFGGVSDWTFTTKKAAPTGSTIAVDINGNGDFCTVQGALDYVPDFSSTPYYINISAGDYEELVYTRNKSNLHIKGSGMDKTIVHYANNEVFNPHPLTVKTNEWPGTFPSRRAPFTLDNCNDCTLEDITVATDYKGQAEGLLLNGEHLALTRVHIIGSGDALQANGTIYMDECEMDGDGDTFLGRGSIFAYHCHLRNDGGPYTWIRNTAGRHGDIFVECDFSTFNGRPVDFGRCPSNNGRGYPDAEQVLINCKVDSVIPEGWSAIGEKTVKFLEFGTTDLKTGEPVDYSKRHPYSKRLDAIKDSTIIREYQDPAFVLNGWNPRK